MPVSNLSCKQYASYLASDLPQYDALVTKDIRPLLAEMIGFFRASTFDAYSGASHSFDRFHSVFPDTTRPWLEQSGTACVGSPCDPPENVIGWGWSRETYALENQSWASPLICFDEVMTKTRAREHFENIISQTLRPAAQRIMSAYLLRKAAELAQKKVAVTTGLPEFTFTWDPGGYIFLNTSEDPTGRLTANILQNEVMGQYLVGGTTAGDDGFSPLKLFTDMLTLKYLQVQDPVLTDAWRFSQFTNAAKEFYQYGFAGTVGDYMVRTLLAPMRFNKIAPGRYQQVLPYDNVAAFEGIKSEPNQDYQNAQYQFSYIAQSDALNIKPFRAQAVNPNMPFLVRDYGGQWKFATNDLGADQAGNPIANYRGNKGKFYADFRLAVKPEHPEHLVLFFHKTDRACITIVDTCNEDPGYPDQNYQMAFDPCDCPSEVVITALANQDDLYTIPANSIRVNGSTITHAAITNAANLAALVAALDTLWGTTLGYDGTWTVLSAPNRTIKLAFAPGEQPVETIELTWDLG